MFLKIKKCSSEHKIEKKKMILLFISMFSIFIFFTENLYAQEFVENIKNPIEVEEKWEKELIHTFKKMIAISDNAVDYEIQKSNDIDYIEITDGHKISEDVIKLFKYKKKLSDLYSKTDVITEKINYKIDLKILSRKEERGFIFYELGKEISYNYIDLPDVLSGEGEIVQIVIKKGIQDSDIEIVDFFVEDDYEIRNLNKVDFSLYQNYLDSGTKEGCYDLLKEISFQKNYEKIEEMVFKSIDEQKEQMPENKKEDHFEFDKNGGNNSINKSWIVDYARRNCSKNDPLPGWGNLVPYYDFSEIPGNYDCTNFVSHSILSGGANLCDNENPNTGWYYRNLNNRSYSWTNVSHLYNFLISGSSLGPYGHEIEYSSYININNIPYEAGDVIQFYYSGANVWMHSGIVSKFYKTKDRKYGALYCARISDGVYEYDKKAEEKYGRDSKRVIVVDGSN